MDLAIVLAKKGGGNVNPNPQVGALIVKEGRIIGQGYHEKYGKAHAEINAFKDCNESPEGATLYVTLEPCAHQGKQPPCFEAIIKNGIKRVVIGHLDPNPLVSGKGIKAMREAGIEVSLNVLEKECEELNKIFFYYVSQGLPYVMMKYAMTLDGKIATSAGQSKWITGEIARQKVHQDRSRFMAIMNGVETLILDDQQLSVRLPPPSKMILSIPFSPNFLVNSFKFNLPSRQETKIISQPALRKGACFSGSDSAVAIIVGISVAVETILEAKGLLK